MKKLMIAAAIVCAAAISQGASFYWGIDNGAAMGPAGESYSDSDGFLLDGIAKLYIGETLIASGSMDGDYKFGSYDTLVSDTTGKVQTLGTGDITSSFAGQAYKIVLETADGAYTWEHSGISTFVSEAGAAGQPNNNYESFVTMDVPNSPSDWTATTVPEPTSGLLLLLGVAGLALRRRRA